MTSRFDEVIDRQHTSTVKFDARKAVFGTDDVIPLWVADMDFASPPEVIDAIKARVDHGVFGYAIYPDSMYQSQIDWCQQRFDWTVNKKQLVMCPGVVPSLVAAITALTEPGDKVIVQSPVYFPFFSAVTEIGRELVLNPLKETAGHYEINFEHLEACAQDGAKTLLFCSPHNPVGRVWTQAELAQLLALAERYEMTIISDEIHGDLILPGYQHLPLATLTDKVKVITAMAPTKTFNIAGLILSSLIVPDNADKKAIEVVLEQWHISARNPMSIVAYEAAYRYGTPWLEALLAYIQGNLELVNKTFEPIEHIKVIQPQGTYLVWLDCRGMGLSDAELKQFFIDKAKVGLSPGQLFGEGGEGFMRLNLGTSRHTLSQALSQIVAAKP
jgi:cystathionine beta-lyase